MEDRIISRLSELENKLDLLIYKVELHNLELAQYNQHMAQLDEVMSLKHYDDGK